MQRVIITTGGTGGHITPALAVAEEIQKRFPQAKLLFLGGNYGPEAEMAAKAGLDFTGLPVRGFVGRGLRGVGAAFGMAKSLFSALRVMSKFSPQLVVGFGGYAAFAGVLAARLHGVRTAIHEQNAFPGISNRLLGRLVKRIYLSMPDASGAFPPNKCVMTGNPVRSGIVKLYDKRKQTASGTLTGDRPGRLLVMGGSQGARAVNDGILSVLPQLQEAGLEIWHLTGHADYQHIMEAYQKADARQVHIDSFLFDPASAYEWADLVLCRAGASSLAEITTAGLPSILVPFPFATHDHQRHNAEYLVKEGAAVVLEQDRFYGEGSKPAELASCILTLMRDKERMAGMAAKSLRIAKPYAAAQLVDELETLLMRG